MSLDLLPPILPEITPVYPKFAVSLYERPDGLGTFAYKVHGRRKTGTPLVLVHGLSAVGTVDWSPLAEHIAKNRPERIVLVFDNRGLGQSTLASSHLNDDFTMQDLADDCIELVKHLGWKKVDLLGFSMGGMIAQCIATRSALPFTIQHLILAATSAKPAHSDLLAVLMPPERPPRTFEEKIAYVRPIIHMGFDSKFVADKKNSKILEERILQSVHTGRPAGIIARQTRAIAGYDVRADYSRITAKIPVLIIHGNLDRSVYFSERKYIERGIPHAKIAETPMNDYGHMWYDYFGTEFWADLIESFEEDREPKPLPKLPKNARL